MITYLVITVLALASGVRTESCPAAEDLYPCVCYVYRDDIHISCSGKELNDEGTLKKALSSLSGKRNVHLDLAGSFELGKVPSDVFSGLAIKNLAFHHCDLDTLSDGGAALPDLVDTLEELHIRASSNDRNSAATLKLGQLKRLKSFSLTSNNIKKMGDDWFKGGPASLEFLSLGYNRFEDIRSNALADLVNLKLLQLEGNKLTTIKRSVFPNPAYQLEHIVLDDNELTELPADVFTDLPVLSSISIDRNKISSLDEQVWSPVWEQVDRIHLEDNPIRCDEHMNWVSELRRPKYVYGSCKSPKELEGKPLKEFIDSKRQ